MRHSEAVRGRIELILPAFSALGRRLWAAPDLARRYPEYLCLVHQMIRASVPLMQAAVAEAQARADDPVSRPLADYLRKHIPEERGHDEWVRQDLAAIGADPDAVWAAMPPPAVAALVGAQYYWLHHHHPVALLGYIAVLEGYPPAIELTEHIMARTGFPKTGLRTLIRHSALDRRHRDELMAAIDALPLTPRHVTTIGLSALHTVRTLVTVFDELLAGAPAPAAAAG